MATTRRFDSDAGRAVAAHPQNLPATNPEDAQLPCSRCGNLTKWKFLSLYGTKCPQCHEAWCDQAAGGDRVLSAAEKSAALKLSVGATHPKAWAHRLKAREEAGERLGEYAAKAWRSALRADLPGATA